jgi:hypothetical protein
MAACSYFFNHFFTQHVLTALMIETVSTPETSVNLCKTTGATFHKTVTLKCKDHLMLQNVVTLYGVYMYTFCHFLEICYKVVVNSMN